MDPAGSMLSVPPAGCHAMRSATRCGTVRGTIRGMHGTAFRDALTSGSTLVLDGGLATQLEAQGEDLSDRLWSARLLIENPEAIIAAHLAYYRAGAQIAISASYQATFEGLAERGIDHHEAAALLRRSVELAEAARDRHRAEVAAGDGMVTEPLLVAASIGPYGAMLADGSEYTGRYGLTVTQLAAFHRARLEVLAVTEADLLAVETIPDLDEVVAIAGLLDELPDATAWISMSCADGGHLRSGAPIEDAVIAAVASRAVAAVGVNCTAPEHVDELVDRIRSTTTLPIVVYPNSGEGWDAAARRWIPSAGADVDAASAVAWQARGATLIGGCCRVTPAQIAAVSAALVPVQWTRDS
jgi:homocysteine S-methyltransferase